MGDYLTPTEVDAVAERNAPIWPQYTATLRAMAEIVEAVATIKDAGNDWKTLQAIIDRARKVRGYE